MKQVGVREFRDHATQYLAGEEVLVVERHGEPIGFYVPAKQRRKEDFARALAELGEEVKKVMEETGLTEEELAQLFDAKAPMPRITRTTRQPRAGDRARSR